MVKKWLLFTTISFGDSISHGKVAYLFHQHHTPREQKAFLVPKQFIRITYIPEGDDRSWKTTKQPIKAIFAL
jgi:hypothetical protein